MTTTPATGGWSVGARLRGPGAAGLYEARDGAGAPALAVVVQGIDEDTHDRAVLQAIGRGAVLLPDADLSAVTAVFGPGARRQAEALFAEFAAAVGLDATVVETDRQDWRPPAPLDRSRRPTFLPPAAAESPSRSETAYGGVADDGRHGDDAASRRATAQGRDTGLDVAGFRHHWRAIVPALVVFLVLVVGVSVAVRPMLVERDELHQLAEHDR